MRNENPVTSDNGLDGFSNHDVQLDGFCAPSQVDFLGDFEAEFLVDLWVDAVTAFEIAEAVFCVSLDTFI